MTEDAVRQIWCNFQRPDFSDTCGSLGDCFPLQVTIESHVPSRISLRSQTHHAYLTLTSVLPLYLNPASPPELSISISGITIHAMHLFVQVTELPFLVPFWSHCSGHLSPHSLYFFWLLSI